MPEILPFLKRLISLPGLSSQEGPVRQVIEEAWRPLVDEITISRLGSLHARRYGGDRIAGGDRSAGVERFDNVDRVNNVDTMTGRCPGLLLAAHMDAIGLMVSGFADGLLRVTSVGGLDPRVLPGQLVTVHGRVDLPGVIVQPPTHLLPPEFSEGVTPLAHLLVDTGFTPDEVAANVRVGDLVSYAQPPLELSGDILAGHSLDNRASVAAVTACLQQLQGRQTAWDVWAVATVGEEIGVIGAITSGYQLRPEIAVAIDVTFASGPGSPESKTFPFGKGITLGWGPNIHPVLFKAFKDLAERLEIPYKQESMPGHSGTDAYGLQVAAEGIPTMVVSIPLRYMHTPVEVVSLRDIERAGRLLAEFAAGLTPDFIAKLAWEDE